MRNRIIFMCLVVQVMQVFGQQAKKEGTFKTSQGKLFRYAYSVPKDYLKNKQYDVLIAPGGGTADDQNDFLFWGNHTENYNWILIETNATVRPKNTRQVAKFLEHLKQQFRPKGGKFHIMGFSANSAGAFKTVLSLPNYFHSITGVPGHPRTTSKKELVKLRHIKVNFIVGERDTYWLNSAKRYIRMLKEMGVSVQLQIVKNGGHVLREIIGDRFMEYLKWVQEE